MKNIIFLLDWCKNNNPKLIDQIDYKKNIINKIDLSKISYANSKKIWWKCDRGHSYYTSVRSRTILNSNCPYCSGRLAIVGENDLATTNPDLLTEWDYEKNKINPNEVLAGSGNLVWSKCNKGHSYESYIYNRIKGVGCPYCAGKKPIIGETDLKSLYPKLVLEWNYEKNSLLKPENFVAGSNKKVWWKCKFGHEWVASISHRTIRKHGCPYCSGRLAIVGENDLATTNPELLTEWDYEKNTLQPFEVKKGTHNSVWWRCKNNHSWKATIYSRLEGNNCPYCGNQKVMAGFNDLATTNPELLKDFDYEKNTFLPSEIIAGSDKYVWWKCSNCGNEWKTKANTRAKNGTGCPKCMKYYATSFYEQAIFYYLKKANINVVNSFKIEGVEIDIFLPDRNIGIEYDGLQWHKDSIDRDNKKDNICLKNDLKLFRIRENGLKKTDIAINVFRKSRSKSDFEDTLFKLFELLGYKIDINISRDRGIIISNYIVLLKNDSLQTKYPDIATEWNYEKNGELKPIMVAPYSNEKVWWKCSKCGNEWETVVANRTLEKTGCPICGRKRIGKTRYNNYLLSGRSIEDKAPNLVAEWDFEKNDKKPSDVLYGDSRKYWWKCNKGHSYLCSPNLRSNLMCGCPYCSGRKILRGYNDFETCHPELMKYWDFDKNIIKPFEIGSGTHKKVWWKCDKGHQWEASIAHIVRGTRCPYCSGRLAIVGENDLATTNPELLTEWDYERNVDISPNEYSKGSHKIVWWKCKKCGYEWEASIKSMINTKCNCPKCKKNKQK